MPTIETVNVQTIHNTMTIPEIIQILQGIQKQETSTKQYRFHLEDLEKSIEDDFTPEQLIKIDRGLADLEAGRTLSEKDMNKKFSQYKDRLQVAIDQRNG